DVLQAAIRRAQRAACAEGRARAPAYAWDRDYRRNAAAAPGTKLALTVMEVCMLQLAIISLVVGLLAGLLGFTSVAGASFAIAKFLAGLFLVLFLVFLILAIAGVRKVVR